MALPSSARKSRIWSRPGRSRARRAAGSGCWRLDERGECAASSSAWLTLALKSTNLPESVVIMFQRPVAARLGAMLPNGINKLLVAAGR